MAVTQQYSAWIRDERWKEKARAIRILDGMRCKRCGKENVVLHVHHMIKNPNLLPWNVSDNYLVTLCADCHKKVHDEGIRLYFREGTRDLVEGSTSYGRPLVDRHKKVILEVMGKSLSALAQKIRESSHFDISLEQEYYRQKEAYDALYYADSLVLEKNK